MPEIVQTIILQPDFDAPVEGAVGDAIVRGDGVMMVLGKKDASGHAHVEWHNPNG